jgi:hypothetical protein
VHPCIDEWFTVLEGEVGFRLDGHEPAAPSAHDWWNADDGEARLIVEVSSAARFEEAVMNTFGLARDGKTNSKGVPNLLQVALFAREFEDVLYFTSPPRPVQRVLFAGLTPVARLLGYRGSYPGYTSRPPSERGEVEPWPGWGVRV